MEKNFKNITNLTSKPQADRIKQIQQKLQYISDTKTNQIKEQRANNSTIRVSNLEKQTSELVRKLQSQLREQKQLLKELTRQHEENSSRQQLSLKNRIIEINQMHNRFTNLLKIELQKTKQTEKKQIMQFEEKMQNLRNAITREIQKRKEYFLLLDKALSQSLPSLQAQTAERMHESSQSLNQIQLSIEKETQLICKQIQTSQAKQLESFEQLMKMMGSVIAQIKEQIGLEKQSRQQNKKKMLTLFEGVCTKLTA